MAAAARAASALDREQRLAQSCVLPAPQGAGHEHPCDQIARRAPAFTRGFRAPLVLDVFTWIGQKMQAQASYLAYIDVFWTLMLISTAAVPHALLLRQVKPGAGPRWRTDKKRDGAVSGSAIRDAPV